jgi:carbamate kinase
MSGKARQSILIAIGGNSLIRAGQKGTIPEQFANARVACRGIAEIVERGYSVVVTHGNGPQVGSQLLRSELGSSQAYTLPLDVCDAMTQGEIGYVLQIALQSLLGERGIRVPVAAVVTQVLVDRNDPAFGHPTKPIGPFYTEETAERKRAELGWAIVEDAARGYRRVVPSPKPLEIVELDVIKNCMAAGMVVIACGGGGIPVVADDGSVRGVEAVIDKDRASALLASHLRVPRMVISTDVEKVFINYKKPEQRPLDSIGVAEARAHIRDGQFLEGSMKPKIEAALDFLEAGGEEVIITNPEHLTAALDGASGTHILGRPNP